MKSEDIEKYYREKYNEDIPLFSSKTKQSIDIEDFSAKIKREEEEKEGYTIVRTCKKRNSYLNQKCKYCEKILYKIEDKEYYLKFSCCYMCYILFEEGKNEKR